MNCPKCQYENPDGSYRCTNCLALLDLPEQYQTGAAQSSASPSPLTAGQPANAEPAASEALLSGWSMPAPAAAQPNAPWAQGEVPNQAWPAGQQQAAAPPPLVESPRYKPSGKCPRATFWKMLIGSVIAAVVAGVIYYYITSFTKTDLVFVGPLLAGALVGAVPAGLANRGKCRNTAAAVLIGLFAGLLMYGVKIGGDIIAERTQIVNGFVKDMTDDGLMTAPKARRWVEAYMTPARSIDVFFQHTDVAITPEGGSSSESSPITGWGFYGYEAFHALLATFTAILIVVATVRRPFCENCDNWKVSTGILVKSPKQLKDVIARVRAQDWLGAHALPNTGRIDNKNHCNVYIERCPGCGDSHVAVKSTSGGSSESVKFYAALDPVTAKALIDGKGRLALAAPPTAEPTASDRGQPASMA